MNLFFQKLNAKRVDSTDVAQIQITQPGADTLFHFVGRFVGKRHAENISCRHAQRFGQIAVTSG